MSIIDCFKFLFDCITPVGPTPVPEIDASSGVAVAALLLSITAVVYRRWQQEHHL